jgi:hypothetical protein
MAKYAGVEPAAKGGQETAVTPTPSRTQPAANSEVYTVAFDTKNGPWSYDVVGDLKTAKTAAAQTVLDHGVTNVLIKDHTGKVVWEGPKATARPTNAPQPQRAHSNGNGSGYNYPPKDGYTLE